MPRVKYLHHPQHFCSLPKIMKTENCHQEQGHKQNYRILLCETLRFGINFQSPVLFRNVNKSKIFTCSIEQHLVFTCNFIYRPKKTQQSLHISIYHPLFSSTAILQSSIFKSQTAKTTQTPDIRNDGRHPELQSIPIFSHRKPSIRHRNASPKPTTKPKPNRPSRPAQAPKPRNQNDPALPTLTTSIA